MVLKICLCPAVDLYVVAASCGSCKSVLASELATSPEELYSVVRSLLSRSGMPDAYCELLAGAWQLLAMRGQVGETCSQGEKLHATEIIELMREINLELTEQFLDSRVGKTWADQSCAHA